MYDIPIILGVYSFQKESGIGNGATQKKHQVVTYYYARQLSEEDFEVQPLNAQHVPSGIRTTLTRMDFLAQYVPEPTFYAIHTVPALESLARKLKMGEKAMENGNLDEAERQFIKALMIDGLNVDANFNLGTVYSEQRNYLKLKQVLDTLLGIHDAFTLEYRQQFNKFGINLRKNGHFAESIRYYKKSLEVIDNDEHVYFNMARAYFDQGLTDDAIESLETALELRPDFAEARKFMKYCIAHEESGLLPGAAQQRA